MVKADVRRLASRPAIKDTAQISRTSNVFVILVGQVLIAQLVVAVIIIQHVRVELVFATNVTILLKERDVKSAWLEVMETLHQNPVVIHASVMGTEMKRINVILLLVNAFVLTTPRE